MPAKTALKPSLTLKRRFAASPERLYAAWIEPKKSCAAGVRPVP